MNECIDHIVYAVPDLLSGKNRIASILGVEVYYGGKHEHHGTHNALVRIGEEIYLEIISSDPDNVKVVSPRWMGVDILNNTARISRWAMKSEISKEKISTLKNYKQDLGVSSRGSRLKPDGTLLEWELTLPAPNPIVEPCPFLIDWPDGVHPTNVIPMECELQAFKIYTTHYQLISSLLINLEADVLVVPSSVDKIELTIRCPNGLITLS